MRHYIYILAGICLFFFSCSSKQYQILFKEKNDNTYQGYNAIDSSAQYKIRPQDIVQVRNLKDGSMLFNNPANFNTAVPKNGGPVIANTNDSQTFQVDDDGTVLLPAIGRIKIAGYTRLEAQRLVEEAYRKDVFNDPIIELKITSLKVIIYGEVKSQGSVPLTKEHMTLVEMIGTAGGLTERADEKNIEIIRGTAKTPKVIKIDLSDIRSINDPRAILQNGDIIYVSQNKRSARNDNFQNFSSSTFQPFLLIVNAALIIFTFVHR